MRALRRVFLHCVFYRALLLTMENVSYVPLKDPIVFELEGFEIPPGQGLLLFFLALLNYTVVVLANGVVVGVIIVDRVLHRPMYMMVCNLASCDMMGATAVLIHLMVHFLTGNNSISYNSAIAQAFTVHFYGVSAQTVLSVMAYDRYLAVCHPLRYHALMTHSKLLFSCSLAWAVAFLCIGVLFSLNVGVPLCGTVIKHVYSSNRSILALSCAPTPANNIYGLCMSWTVSTGTFLIIAFCYVKILHACVKSSADRGSYSKAMQTCATHLVIYVIYEISAAIIILSHRFDSISQNIKKFCSILFIIVPPTINPIIYGLVTKELRTSILRQFTKLCAKHKIQDVKLIRK
ncbi:olfactory receptor 2A12-like [Osmerus mordax]|uniref:olfactory receptor 2A12-like n=1 Tax=Osmerus mordax TaxID=8014 RepID=UPI003510302A